MCNSKTRIAWATIKRMDSTTAALEKSDQNLVWIDCEMSGLEPTK